MAAEHAAFMDGLVDEGFLVLGGPLFDERRIVHAVEAESEEAVRATLARDPWSGTHLVVAAIEPWTIRLDGRRRAWRTCEKRQEKCQVPQTRRLSGLGPVTLTGNGPAVKSAR